MNPATILNMDDGFTPFGEGEIYAKLFAFPGGEEYVKLLNTESGCIRPFKDEIGYINEVNVTARLSSSSKVIQLIMATDAIRRMSRCNAKINLVIPYFPYARQDRVMTKGESLSAKVMADLINAQKYNSVTIFDPHSSVTPALVGNVIAINNERFVDRILRGKHGYLLVSPDAGASKKIEAVAKAIGYSGDIVQAGKVRDVATGRITSTTIDHKDLRGKDCCIIDDICDGGATFSMLAKELKDCGAGKVCLIVSHGIFSNGTKIEGIEHSWCSDSFRSIGDDGHITQIKLNAELLY